MRNRRMKRKALTSATAIAEKHSTKWPFFVMDLTSLVLGTHSSLHTATLRSKPPTLDLVADEMVASESFTEAGQTLLACANFPVAQ
ncbi:hypothetical protein Ahy_A05g022135 isoform A [Arachis hypogaea]|uniref:Uncharacterized protein n=1 Tax=Arachis hypogaea TaxID=3818 RepID=A0A445CZU9_ARAHY|nr:hypothetical protein Ahy_A05g022135 isoform A [Arachis hypogaea]